MRADLNIISGRGLNPWPDTYRPKRYYVDFWRKRFIPDIEQYNAQYSVHRRQDEISVYFDTEGFLHVVCLDRGLAMRIEQYFERWYDYVCKEKYDDSAMHCHVGLMIEPFSTDLKNGFVQIRYKGLVCNLSPEQLRDIRDIDIQVYDMMGGIIAAIDTGIPRLDAILRSMLEDGEIWPYKGKFFDEKVEEFGVLRVFTTSPFWWMAFYTPNSRFWSPER